MCDGNVKEHPKGGTLLVVNIKNAQNKVTPPLPLLKAEIECRTDGYRWGLNQGNKIAGGSSICFWLSRNPLFPDDPKQHVNFRKIFFKSDLYPGLGVVHYFGNDEIALKDYKHGNAVNVTRAYKPALKSVLAEERTLSESNKPLGVYNKVSQAALHKPNPQLAMPRNYDQIYYAAKSQRQKQRISPFTLFNAISLSKHLQFDQEKWKSHPNFITDIRIAQNSLSIHIMFTPMMVEMLSVMKSYEGVMVLYYDPTYNIGDYYVSCLTWYHPFFNKYEIIAMHVHTTRHGELHKDFIEAVGRKFGFSSLTRIFLIITDMEFNFKNLWANLRHLYCSLHLNRNLKKKLAELLLDEYALCDLNVTFIELKTVQTYAEFDKKLKKEVEEHVAIFATDPEIIEVFMKYCTKLRNKASIPALLTIIGEKETDINTAISLTSNPGESINDVFKEHIPLRRELLLDELLVLTYNVASFQYNEILRGYHQSGNLHLQPKYRKLERPPSELDYSTLIVIPDIILLSEKIAKGENLEDRGSNLVSVFCVEAMAENYHISSNNLNQHIVNIKGEPTALVVPSTKKNSHGKFDCSCKATGNCLHIMGVLKHLNDPSYFNSEEVCGDPLREDRRVNNYSRSGRKRPRPEDFIGVNVIKQEEDGKPKMRKVVLEKEAVHHEKTANDLLMDVRNGLQRRSREAFSFFAIPPKSYELPESETWILNIVKDTCKVDHILYHSFHHPLPVMKDKEVILCVSENDGLQVVTRVKNELHAVLLYLIDDDPNSTVNLFGMCGRDLNKVKVKMAKHDTKATATLREKLVIAASLVKCAVNGENILNKKFITKRLKNVSTDTVESVMKSATTVEYKGEETSVKFYCCCQRSYVPSQSAMVQCSNCNKWFFMSCYAGSGSFNKSWSCCSCMGNLSLYIKWGRDSYSNTCTLDNFLMAIFLNDKTGVIGMALEQLPSPSLFEASLLTFLNACRLATSNAQLLQAKYNFIDDIYETRDLYSSEDKVWNEALVFSQYGVQCRYICDCGTEFAHPTPFDYLTTESVKNIEELVSIQTSFNVRRTCKSCGTIVEPSQVKFVAQVPFILSVRLASMQMNDALCLKDLEQIPFYLTVNAISYRLACISFHEAGHYISIIFCNKFDVIYYDGRESATPMTLRTALEKVMTKKPLLSFITYLLNNKI